MQRTLFIVVAAVAVILAGVLFFALRPKPTVSLNDAAQGARLVFGPADAKVTVVDFSNYLCPHCRDHALEVLPVIKKEYIDTGKIRYVFRDFPFTGQDSVIRAGEAAACAADANLFFEYHEALFRSQAQWANLSGDALDQFFADVAGQLGMAPATMLECLKSGKKQAGVLADRDMAAKLGLDSTPTFIVNGVKFSGSRGADSLNGWRKMLDDALAGKPVQPPQDGVSSQQ
ncbi:MAG: DsbA family protein [Thermaceae bacterium]|nr:DsbA family protein [Thermaceae bacterium]